MQSRTTVIQEIAVDILSFEGLNDLDLRFSYGCKCQQQLEISQLNLQVRYRWQIAPLSDLFVVYQRGDRRRVGLTDFDDLFQNSWNDPLGDLFIIKLRYRLGS